ncbi:MAG TPA: CPBP family glutamic-type intramembrane protease, partial [Anaerolineaceae bacterium]|nr:CPBP family glutamic-type intramembrane protease [Anaerolineaceae bacterium]
MEAVLPYLAEWLGVLGVVWLAGISPKFNYPVLGFKYPRREGRLTLVVFAVTLVFVFIQAGGWLRPLLISDNPAFQPALTRLNLALFTLIPFIVALLLRRQPVYSGFGSGIMVGVNLRLGLALAFGTMFLRGKFTLVMDGVGGDEGAMLLVSAAICAIEEFIFRGFIQLRLRSWLGEGRGWIATAGLFVLWQIP